MRERLRLLRRLPAKVIARRAMGLARRKIEAFILRRLDQGRRTFGPAPSAPLLPLIVSAPARQALAVHAPWIRDLARLYRDNRFDLLGSGWVQVRHGMDCPGVEGHAHRPASPGPLPLNRGNRAHAAGLRALLDPSYRPIDWQLDFKSGHRWDEGCWAADIAFGHRPGVDVKVPWELARMQHLLVLAWSFGLDGDDADRRTFRNQVLDFIAANPPRFGVNWRCPMDVGIRVANWLVARDLFVAQGASFDPAFEQAFAASVADHARHLAWNLEWFPEGRGNHYLADVCGLLFAAAALPASPETDAWLAFAAQEVVAETEAQFLPDGANFEASTCYHRLSAEMVVHASALLAGLPPERLRPADPRALRTRPARPLRQGSIQPPGPDHWRRIEAMAVFTRLGSKPDHRVAQIGDNDSGRFLRAHPVLGAGPQPEEDMLDHRPLVAAVSALVPRPDLDAWAGGPWLDAELVRCLARGRQFPAGGVAPSPSHGEALAASPPEPCSRVEILLPGADLRQGMRTAAFPHFGLFVMSSERLWLALRCGPIGQRGRGGHAHNDQLSMELTVDGVDWLRDPGTYLYTADRSWRNRYRSVAAHAAPRRGDSEPGSLGLGDFWLGDEAKGCCLSFGPGGFLGRHQGYASPTWRRVEVLADRIVVEDHPGDGMHRQVSTKAEALTALGSGLDFSPAYGRRQCGS